MSSITTRRAVPADSGMLAPMFDSYRGFYGRPSDLEAAEQFLRERLERAESLVLYADAGSQRPLGFVQLYKTFSSLQMRPALILNDLYVCPEARRRGVARHLMQGALALARELGAVSLQLETANSNDAARHLYESEGYRCELLFSHYSLEL